MIHVSRSFVSEMENVLVLEIMTNISIADAIQKLKFLIFTIKQICRACALPSGLTLLYKSVFVSDFLQEWLSSLFAISLV